MRYLLFTHVIPPLPLEALEGPLLGKSRQIFHGPSAWAMTATSSACRWSHEITRTDRLATFR